MIEAKEQGQHSEQAETHNPMIQVAGKVYNRDHIVFVDLEHADEGIVAVHTTLGVHTYTADVARQVARFFSAREVTPAAPQAMPKRKAG